MACSMGGYSRLNLLEPALGKTGRMQKILVEKRYAY